MNVRKYVKIMINTNETGLFCHKFCRYNREHGCSLFNSTFDIAKNTIWKKSLDGNDFYNHVRLPQCEECEIKY